jgi:multidrug efflux pump subunit AcrA (membrane-fusion protein)
MWVDFNLPQFYGELAPGSRVEVRVVRTEALGSSKPLAAEVIAGDASINAAARSRRYRAVVAEGSRQLLDNMSVTVEVPLGLGTSVMAVPSLAMRSDAEGEFVYVLDRDPGGASRASRRMSIR